jgi:hypothetical protein
LVFQKVKQILEKEIPEAMVIDNSPKDQQAKEDIIRSCWSSDPVHANLHTYCKLAWQFHRPLQQKQNRRRAPETKGTAPNPW